MATSTIVSMRVIVPALTLFAAAANALAGDASMLGNESVDLMSAPRAEGFVVVASPNSTQSLPADTYRICNNANGWCLEPSGSVVTVTDNAGYPPNNQLWYYAYVGQSGGSNYYNILNYGTGKCLDVTGGSYADGATLTTSTCCAQCTSQWWKQQNEWVAGLAQFRDLPSGKCIDLPVNYPSMNWTGYPVQQWTCGGQHPANQYWALRNY